jgi:hypothetical protein
MTRGDAYKGDEYSTDVELPSGKLGQRWGRLLAHHWMDLEYRDANTNIRAAIVLWMAFQKVRPSRIVSRLQ